MHLHLHAGNLIIAEANRASVVDLREGNDIGGDSRSGRGIVFTIGYEGRSSDSFRSTLVDNDIGRMVDVRQMPRSRKPGFSKRSLSHLLSESGIEYIHMELLGSPRAAREKLKETGDLSSFLDSYKKHLVSVSAGINTLVRLADEMPTAIMCLERDASKCHRSVIAARLRELGFEVKDL
jgi:uncharacterized protein (DUF488 family)